MIRVQTINIEYNNDFFTLKRDGLGEIVKKVEKLNKKEIKSRYKYDLRGRLIEVKRGGKVVESYSYDANGNRLLATIYGKTYQANYNQDDQLIKYGKFSYSYDEDGYLASKSDGNSTTNYEYGIFGELKRVVTPTKTIEYLHNANHQRVAKKVNGEMVEKYLWLNLTRLLAIYDKDDNLVWRFEYADSRMPITIRDKNGTKYYLHYDQVGSLRAVSNQNREILKEIIYDTFGNIISDSNTSLKVPFGFAGGLYDSDTKLVRFGFRDYDPFTGRWTAKDPILFAGGDTNLYGYVLGDPVSGVDFDGLKIIPLGTKKEKLLIYEWLRQIAIPELSIKLWEMWTSKENFYIKFDDEASLFGGGSYNPRNNTCSLHPDFKSANKKSFYYHSGGLLNLKIYYYHPQAVLVHELLGHGYDDLKNKQRDEQRAINIANEYRKFRKWPLRNF